MAAPLARSPLPTPPRKPGGEGISRQPVGERGLHLRAFPAHLPLPVRRCKIGERWREGLRCACLVRPSQLNHSEIDDGMKDKFKFGDILMDFVRRVGAVDGLSASVERIGGLSVWTGL
ncbi:uncharacterized protein LOC112271696 [Brachypodium distachyon]|uniref:uncharacterized protein LOC112271696 n=1 Tax=Brachypodium distachyon TaxID=15368 RepID=UPI000D0E206F|nr:uncharacterized protein LOC112271696 [Brachypodium distachyon]|eukprot:XP_024317226.1 uncharacterized protein LOC112271696 [Brachypodium distachyon]